VAFRRYLLVSSGISSTALGLALIISSIAAGLTGASAGSLMRAESSSVRVVAVNRQVAAQTLDDVLAQIATPEVDTALAGEQPAEPIRAIVIQGRGEASQEPTPGATAAATPPAKAAIIPPGAPPPAVRAAPTARAVAQPPASLVGIGRIDGVNLTFYDCLDQGFCGRMSSGEVVYEGAAACSWNLPQGTHFRIVGDPTKRIYVCMDRGMLDDTWVDIFFHDPEDGWEWQKAVGRHGTIEILQLP
jgi:hypothetical protein